MTVRTTSKTVTFMHPFNLSGMDEMQPAGTYTVETDEELLQTSSLPAYKRISTLIRLPVRPRSTGDPDRCGRCTGTRRNPSERRTAGRNNTATDTWHRCRASEKIRPAGWKSSVKAGNTGLPSTPMI
jgi:hypothetical protein